MRFYFKAVVLTLSAAGLLTSTQSDPTTTESTTLLGGTAGDAYRTTLTAVSGPTPDTWNVVAGQPSTGLKLSGLIPGSGQFSFTTQVQGTIRLLDSAAPNVNVGAQSDVLAESDVLWTADMETGDTSQWYVPSQGPYGDYGGGEYNSGVAGSAPSQDYAHTGVWSLKMTITTPSSPSSGTRMFRWLESRNYPALYYSAWYYFPQSYSVDNYWNVFQWKSRRSPDQNDPFYILNVGNRDDGSMYFYVYDWQRRISYSQSSMNIPVGQWFRVQALYQCSGDGSGRVTFWQDGVQLLDLPGVQTRYPDGDCEWSLNNYSDGLRPSTSTIYIDDAKITLAR